jgi:hypothetical protein
MLGLLEPWGQHARTLTDGKMKGDVVAEGTSRESQCAKRRSTIKLSSAYCVQRSPIVWNVKGDDNGA